MKSPLILRVFKDEQLIEVKQFDYDQIVIGRNAEVQLDLNHDSVSSIHALIELRDNGYYICDLGSQSGTLLNNQAILDEQIKSGDQLQIGVFKIHFFVGVPKPKSYSQPLQEIKNKEVNSVDHEDAISLKDKNVNISPQAVIPQNNIIPNKQSSDFKIKPQVKSLDNDSSKDANTAAHLSSSVSNYKIRNEVVQQGAILDSSGVIADRPMIRKQIHGSVEYKKKKRGATFSPPDQINDLKSFIKPTKGNVIQVIVAWDDRIIETYHFRSKGIIKFGSDINVPEANSRSGHKFLIIGQTVQIALTQDMDAEVVSANGSLSLQQILQSGKAQSQSSNSLVRLDQNEVVHISFPKSQIKLIVRFVPAPPLSPLIPPLFFSSTEITGVILAIVMVLLLSFYIEANKPKIQEEAKNEDLTRTAAIIFNSVPTPLPTATPIPTPLPTPPPVVATPIPTPQKIKMTDQKLEEKQKSELVNDKKGGNPQVAKKAAEVAPIPNSQNKPKKFTSAIKQGGAVKLGENAGANAQSAKPKDVSKMGLMSAFGGGGIRGKLDQAYSGAGDLLGEADKATGSSGMAQNRAGDDLGSKFKDDGAGGKGISTQGISGIGTKGRSTGQSAYGSENGFGNKTTVAVEAGGAEEDFVGTIDKEAVRRVIKAGYREIRGCYEKELNRLGKSSGKNFEGKVVISWEIIAGGKPKNVKVKSTSLGNPQVENCLRDRIASWIYPEPPAGLTAEVAYPFVFRPQEK